MDINKEIGKRISEIRSKYLKMNQIEFAEKLKMKQENISRMENGVTCPTIATIIKLHTLFNIDIQWLIMGIQSTPYDNKHIIEEKNEMFENLVSEPLIEYLSLQNKYSKLLENYNSIQSKYIELLETGHKGK